MYIFGDTLSEDSNTCSDIISQTNKFFFKEMSRVKINSDTSRKENMPDCQLDVFLR